MKGIVKVLQAQRLSPISIRIIGNVYYKHQHIFPRLQSTISLLLSSWIVTPLQPHSHIIWTNHIHGYFIPGRNPSHQKHKKKVVLQLYTHSKHNQYHCQGYTIKVTQRWRLSSVNVNHRQRMSDGQISHGCSPYPEGKGYSGFHNTAHTLDARGRCHCSIVTSLTQ